MLNRLTACVAVGALIAAQPVPAAPASLAEAFDLWSNVLTRSSTNKVAPTSTPSRRTARPSTSSWPTWSA